jgi:drug/metabolite transporter (DMT)-like permease
MNTKENRQVWTLSAQESVHTHEKALATPNPLLKLREHLSIGIALLALYLIWGSTYLGMSFALEGFPPFMMSGIRFLLAGTILYIILRIRKAPNPTGVQWRGAAVVGILLLAGGNTSVAFAEQWVASGLAAVAIAATPLWFSLIMGLLGKWPTRWEWAGLLLGFAGVVLLNMENGLWANPIGAIALLLAPFLWSIGSALSTRLSMPEGLMSSAAQMLVGGAVILLSGLVMGERITSWPVASSLWAMLFLILFGSLIAFSAYGYLLKRVRPALATSYAYVNPVVAVILGILLGGEKFTPVALIAMPVILVGVALVSLRRKHS